ncbi:hypothetical protein VP01_502g2 [Puccinia sorghi]|uniref:Uncharacterized protein n=1 Tax=Puccinia sorghi TaxID=27349 RepID=A0A0L6ULL1_9BASI|nr:hypothetical protein VP01_502g2 [Puccinia sorghi]
MYKLVKIEDFEFRQNRLDIWWVRFMLVHDYKTEITESTQKTSFILLWYQPQTMTTRNDYFILFLCSSVLKHGDIFILGSIAWRLLKQDSCNGLGRGGGGAPNSLVMRICILYCDVATRVAKQSLKKLMMIDWSLKMNKHALTKSHFMHTPTCACTTKEPQLSAVDMQKVPGSLCCYPNFSPRLIQPSFDAQSLCRLHIEQGFFSCSDASIPNWIKLWIQDHSCNFLANGGTSTSNVLLDPTWLCLSDHSVSAPQRRNENLICINMPSEEKKQEKKKGSLISFYTEEEMRSRGSRYEGLGSRKKVMRLEPSCNEHGLGESGARRARYGVSHGRQWSERSCTSHLHDDNRFRLQNMKYLVCLHRRRGICALRKKLCRDIIFRHDDSILCQYNDTASFFDLPGCCDTKLTEAKRTERGRWLQAALGKMNDPCRCFNNCNSPAGWMASITRYPFVISSNLSLHRAKGNLPVSAGLIDCEIPHTTYSSWTLDFSTTGLYRPSPPVHPYLHRFFFFLINIKKLFNIQKAQGKKQLQSDKHQGTFKVDEWMKKEVDAGDDHREVSWTESGDGQMISPGYPSRSRVAHSLALASHQLTGVPRDPPPLLKLAYVTHHSTVNKPTTLNSFLLLALRLLSSLSLSLSLTLFHPRSDPTQL